MDQGRDPHTVTGNQADADGSRRSRSDYLSGWQVAADANVAGAMYPDQSLYPAYRNVPLAPNPLSVSRRAARVGAQSPTSPKRFT